MAKRKRHLNGFWDSAGSALKWYVIGVLAIGGVAAASMNGAQRRPNVKILGQSGAPAVPVQILR